MARHGLGRLLFRGVMVPDVILYAVEIQEWIADLKRRRRSVRPREIDALLVAAGFARRYGKGDHRVYTHPARRLPLTIDPRNPLLPVYVSRAIQAIEEVIDGEKD